MHPGCHSVEVKRPLGHRNCSSRCFCTQLLGHYCDSSKYRSLQGVTQRAKGKKLPFLLPLVSGGVSGLLTQRHGGTVTY